MVSLDTTSAIKTLAINLAGKANRKTIVAGMEELISDGLLAVGSKLPTSKELAGMLGVSGGTLQAAMHELTDRGYLSR
ncbi:MAG: GntR family transcriptional regulator, partial [Candidatus Pacebacteria bacterium]|nr:GntR family transcriptional regulator [Candidatus Paceibacterota bacterium]